MMRFADPWFLVLLVALVPIIAMSSRAGGKIRFSNIQAVKGLRAFRAQVRFHPRMLIVALRVLAATLFVVALARPQAGRVLSEATSDGVDILLALDTSGSMRALDFRIDDKPVQRLDVVKKVVTDFIKSRSSDRMGLIVFGEEAFVQCPLTLDHGILLDFLKQVEIGMAGDATALGSAVGVGVQRIKDLEAKSKIMILLTDGRSNAGRIPPHKAAEIAKSFGVKVYTIGIGTEGNAPFLADGFFGKRYVYRPVDIDEETLQTIAKATDARYFRAKGTEELREIYQEIDALEKTETKVKEYTEYNELFHLALLPGVFLLALEILLGGTVLRKIP